jgi:hypothetical protein
VLTERQLREKLAALVEQHAVPGAQLAVLDGDSITEVAAGVLSRRTDDSFLLKLPIADADLLAVFFTPDEPAGRPSHLHFGGRAHRRLP